MRAPPPPLPPPRPPRPPPLPPPPSRSYTDANTCKCYNVFLTCKKLCKRGIPKVLKNCIPLCAVKLKEFKITSRHTLSKSSQALWENQDEDLDDRVKEWIPAHGGSQPRAFGSLENVLQDQQDINWVLLVHKSCDTDIFVYTILSLSYTVVNI